MRRFYFNLRNGQGYLRDEEGTELADAQAARHHAITAIRGLLSAEVSEGHLDMRGYIEVTDESGGELLRLPFSDAVEVCTGPLPRQ